MQSHSDFSKPVLPSTQKVPKLPNNSVQPNVKRVVLGVQDVGFSQSFYYFLCELGQAPSTLSFNFPTCKVETAQGRLSGGLNKITHVNKSGIISGPRSCENTCLRFTRGCDTATSEPQTWQKFQRPWEEEEKCNNYYGLGTYHLVFYRTLQFTNCVCIYK